MKTKTKKRKAKPSSRALELHAALSPMADGCMKTSLLAYKLAAKRRFRDDQGAHKALDLAAETLAKINGLIALAVSKRNRT